MNLQADLHTHTVHSDGILTVDQLFEKAKKVGFSGLSITDHDTLSGVKEGLQLAENYKFRFLPGVEITTHLEMKEIHLLSYAIDPHHEELNTKLKLLLESREKRAEAIVDNLALQNVKIDYQKIKKKAKGAAITRPHIANELMEAGYVNNFKQAFDKFLADDLPAFESKEIFDIKEAIELVHRAGGKAVVAHPGRYIDKSEMRQLINWGLDGIEVMHPSHSNYYIRYWRRWCIENKLIATGGSDYHGSRPYDDDNFGNWKVNANVIDELKA